MYNPSVKIVPLVPEKELWTWHITILYGAVMDDTDNGITQTIQTAKTLLYLVADNLGTLRCFCACSGYREHDGTIAFRISLVCFSHQINILQISSY